MDDIVNSPITLKYEDRKELKPEHIHAMSRFDISVNCQTFFCFTLYALNNFATYNQMNCDSSYKPWLDSTDGLVERKYLIPDEDNEKKMEMRAHYDLHYCLLLKNPTVKVKKTSTMGLGLFAKNDLTTYEHLRTCYGPMGLFGYIEWLDNEAFQWFQDNRFPSLYEDPEGNKGILYGPLYFCNHQPWGATFEAVEEGTAQSYQAKLTTIISSDTIDVTIMPLIKYNPQLLSQNISTERKEKDTEDPNKIITTKQSSYYIVVLKVDDWKENVKVPYNILNSSRISAVDNFYIEIFMNYGEDFNKRVLTPGNKTPNTSNSNDRITSTLKKRKIYDSIPRNLIPTVSYNEHCEYKHYQELTGSMVTLFKVQNNRLLSKLKDEIDEEGIERCSAFLKEVENLNNHATALANQEHKTPTNSPSPDIVDYYASYRYHDELLLAKAVSHIATNSCFLSNEPEARDLMHDASEKVKNLDDKHSKHNDKLLNRFYE